MLSSTSRLSPVEHVSQFGLFRMLPAVSLQVGLSFLVQGGVVGGQVGNASFAESRFPAGFDG